MAVFVWAPSLPATVSRKPGVLSAAFGDGYEQTAPVGINSIPETWDLQFNSIDETTANAIDDFLKAQNTASFQWANNRSVVIKVRCKEWSVEVTPAALYNVKAKFEQYFGT